MVVSPFDGLAEVTATAAVFSLLRAQCITLECQASVIPSVSGTCWWLHWVDWQLCL